MKALYIALLFCGSCKAQSTIKPLYLKSTDVSGTYYKDLDNNLNNFTGTWQYVNGTDILQIKLVTKTQFYNENRDVYIDYVVGEYKYIDNSVEKINTLSNLDNVYSDIHQYNIAGCSILKKTTAPVCDDCTTNERRLALAFSDPTRPGIMDGLSGEVVLRRVDVGSVQKIEVWLRMRSPYRPPAGTDPDPEQFGFNVPWGTYTLTKIN